MKRTINKVALGYMPLVLADIAKDKGRILHICISDAQMQEVAQALKFFAPEIQVFKFPAWDTVPYDRISPNQEIIAERIKTLAVLAERNYKTPVIVLTTANASCGKIAPLDYFKDSSFTIKAGESCDLSDFKRFLVSYGYNSASQVMQKGEFAARGGIFDVFPINGKVPLRLDMFGDTVEKIRTFDAVTQKSIGKIDGFTFLPAAEFTFSEDSIALFRKKYRALFGTMIAGDEVYESVSAGNNFLGIENWLCLFYPELATLFDYVKDFTVTFSYQADTSVQERAEQVKDFYNSRMEALTAADDKKNSVASSFKYRPVPYSDMFLLDDDYEKALKGFDTYYFSPFDDTQGINMDSKVSADFTAARANPEIDLFKTVYDLLINEMKTGKKAIIACVSSGSRERLSELFKARGFYSAFADTYTEACHISEKNKTPAMIILPLSSGFSSPDLIVLTEEDILGERIVRSSAGKKKSKDLIGDISSLNIDDLVVHEEHGIGRYNGLETLKVSGAVHDFLCLIYAGGDKLYVPVENIEVLSRYGSEEAGVRLDSLGSAAWQARKSKLKKRIKDIADKLIKAAAERYLQKAPVIEVSPAYNEFAARFPYVETDDQSSSIADVLDDLQKGVPMDRLVCGDVGFGKTEVALRAAFNVAMAGYQVVMLAPTTLLARQHYELFIERFKGYPLRIGQFSRIVSSKEAALVKKELESGTIDIVIGTHALLQKTVKFARIGLVIVDEEQHFGVVHKERIKELAKGLHILTLTATPIPRTLQLALSGVRQMSIIATPPVDRLAVRSFVLPYDPVILREAVLREHFRGGQIFYVCPKISDIAEVYEHMKELVPEIKILTADGQMSATELQKRVSDFTARKYDMLIATTIIESGIDMPSVNTIIIHRSDMFGLSQLYQLRGRVGRSKTRAYSYFTIPKDKKKLTATAQKRLSIMQSLDSLGEGFNLASYDLDIRGAGNLLGEEQSGHIKEVGVELYQKMLEEAVSKLQSDNSNEADEDLQEDFSPEIQLGIPVLIPEDYVSDLSLRLSLYRKLAGLSDLAEIEPAAAEIIDRFGSLPKEINNLLAVIAIKILAKKANIEKIEAGEKGAVLTLHDGIFPNPEGLIKFIQEQCGMLKVKENGKKLVYLRNFSKESDRMRGVRTLCEKLAALAE